jgi:hypothetical protein
MGEGVVLWGVGKHFLVKHVVDGMLPSPVTDPSAVPSGVRSLLTPIYIISYGRYNRPSSVASVKLQVSSCCGATSSRCCAADSSRPRLCRLVEVGHPATMTCSC